jgi:amidase
MSFDLLETTIDRVHEAYGSRELTCSGLVGLYLDRIGRLDKHGPAINSIITVNPRALEEAERLDKATGPAGPLHGIPIVVKDQADALGMPTTLGSVLFREHHPDRDSFVIDRLRKAGAVVLAKATLGELGAGDAHGSLFGSTRNPYDLERTAGGSSGGSGAAVSANFCTVAVGQEGFASIRRPSTWNGVAGMRPTAGLVSRGGVFAGWPSINGSLGPMARTVADLAKLLDSMVGYDPEDPLTARGAAHAGSGFSRGLDANALKGARLGILREPMGYESEPGSADFADVTTVFDRAVGELRACGAEVMDPVVIPGLQQLLAKRASSHDEEEDQFAVWASRSSRPAYRTRPEAIAATDFAKVNPRTRDRWAGSRRDDAAHYAYLKARDELMTRMLKVMTDHRLDAIVHKAVEHSPTLIRLGTVPPYVDQKGAPHINTFLVFVPSIVVPAGFTAAGLPAGITFLGRPYEDARMIRLAYAYEQATRHRRPPKL